MTIALKTRLTRSAIPEGEEARLYLLVQLAGAAQVGGDRPPLNLAAVIDRSGSMAGPKLAYTKQALRFLVDQLAEPDFLSIVAFDDQVGLVFPAGHVMNKEALKARVGALEDGGSTNLSGGMIEGYKQVRKHLAPRQVNRVLLMTDGQANVGVTNPDALVGKVTELCERGIQISTLGVGADFNEDLLTAMAGAGGGNFYFIENPDQVPAIFAKELQGLLATVAQGLEVVFSPAPGVAVLGAAGMSLPDLYAGEVKSLIFELAVEASFAGERALGQVLLTGVAAADGSDLALTQDLSITVTGDSLLLGAPEDPEVLREVYLARSAEALDQAVQQADRQNFAASGAVLREAVAPMLDLALATGDEELLARGRELADRAVAMEGRSYDAVARKQMKAQSFQTRTGRRP